MATWGKGGGRVRRVKKMAPSRTRICPRAHRGGDQKINGPMGTGGGRRTVRDGSSYTYDKIVPFVKSLRVSGFKGAIILGVSPLKAGLQYLYHRLTSCEEWRGVKVVWLSHTQRVTPEEMKTGNKLATFEIQLVTGTTTTSRGKTVKSARRCSTRTT